MARRRSARSRTPASTGPWCRKPWAAWSSRWRHRGPLRRVSRRRLDRLVLLRRRRGRRLLRGVPARLGRGDVFADGCPSAGQFAPGVARRRRRRRARPQRRLPVRQRHRPRPAGRRGATVPGTAATPYLMGCLPWRTSSSGANWDVLGLCRPRRHYDYAVRDAQPPATTPSTSPLSCTKQPDARPGVPLRPPPATPGTSVSPAGCSTRCRWALATTTAWARRPPGRLRERFPARLAGAGGQPGRAGLREVQRGSPRCAATARSPPSPPTSSSRPAASEPGGADTAREAHPARRHQGPAPRVPSSGASAIR